MNIFVLLAGLTFSLPAQAATFSFSGTAVGRYAQHTSQTPGGPASQRAELNLQQKISLPPKWTLIVGGRGFYENVYNASKQVYPETLRKQDTYEIRPQDTYAEYKSGNFVGRLGYQQVVWGETFGNMYADFINPRDLRDGAPLDVVSSRLSIPMIFGKYIGEKYSLEGLLIPRPEFHIMPLPGSDFAPISKEELPSFNNVEVERERYWWGSEYGSRVTSTIGSTDVSAFYMNHFDRYPYYEVAPGTVPGATLRLRERHQRINTFGGGAASEINGYVARVELVHNAGRLVPIRRPASIDYVTAGENAGVFSVDLPSWKRLNISLQISNSRLDQKLDYVLRDQDQSNAGVRVMWGMFNSSNLELLAVNSLTDKGSRVQADFMTPLTSSLEVHAGAEWFGGAVTSEYGRLHEASRVYISLKSYLSAIPEKPLSRFAR